MGFGLLVLIQAGTSGDRAWAVLVLSATLNLQWLANVFAHLMRLPVEWFEAPHRRHLVALLRCSRSRRTLTTSFIEAVLDGLLVVLTLAMMFVYSGADPRWCWARWRLRRLLRWAFFSRCATIPKGAGAQIRSPVTSSLAARGCRRSSCSMRRPTGGRASPAWWWTR